MRFAFWIPIIYWFLMNLANIFDAAGDAVAKRNKWILSKTYQTLMILSYCAMIPLAIFLPPEFITLRCWLYFILMDVLIRIGVFNVTWGLFRFCYGYWWYLGDTSLWDKFLVWLINDSWVARKLKPPEKFALGWFYVISWVLSIGVLAGVFYLIPE